MKLDQVPFTPEAILDIGANVGGFYKEASARWPSARFMLIEGNPSCAVMLEPLNVPFHIALLGEKNGTSKFWVRKNAPTCTGCSRHRELTEFYSDENAIPIELPMVTLDSLLEGRRVFDLIKIDVQGGELEVIEGGIETIRQAKAVIMEVSIEQYNEGAPLQHEVRNSMAALGFKPVCSLQSIVHPIKRHHIQDDMLFMR